MTKIGKHANLQVMGRDRSIADSLPETRFFTGGSLAEMLKRYGTVILKPNYGSGGAGVVKVVRLPQERYSVHSGTAVKVISGHTVLVNHLRRLAKGKTYIVQRYVELAKVHGRPFDLRVMVQRKKNVPWRVTGKLAKVAGPRQIITNVARSKGYVLPARSALRHNFPARQSAAILSKLNSIGLRAAKQIGVAYGYPNLGFDMAVDRRGKVWVLELNSKPSIGFFKRLKDKSYYRNIVSMLPR